MEQARREAAKLADAERQLITVAGISPADIPPSDGAPPESVEALLQAQRHVMEQIRQARIETQRLEAAEQAERKRIEAAEAAERARLAEEERLRAEARLAAAENARRIRKLIIWMCVIVVVLLLYFAIRGGPGVR
jgi:hypothetical protein